MIPKESLAADNTERVEELTLTGSKVTDQYDVSLALSDLGRVLGVPLLSQLPPRPGQFGLCSYCKRKGVGSAERCPRCDGSGKCHLCRGTGRMRR